MLLIYAKAIIVIILFVINFKLFDIKINNNINFNVIYKKCYKLIQAKKCNENGVMHNDKQYGYEFHKELLNSSDCQLCITMFNISHLAKCKNGIIKTHRSYNISKYRCYNESYKLYGTDVIQNWIYTKQNTHDCENKKFLIVPYWGGGFGSQIHVMGSYLGLALNSNRIALNYPIRVSRYIIPLSNCTIKLKNEMQNKSYDVYSDQKYVYQKKYTRLAIPLYVINFLKESPISSSHYLHYWRIQASTYIYRLKRDVKKKIKKVINKNIRYNYNNKKINKYPCINVWVRHGDKYREMKLIETHKYFYAINLLKRIIDIQFNIYLSTDDRNVINYFIKSNYNVLYLNYSRYNDNNSKWMNNHMYNILSDIELSLKCVAFVGTRGSNINRLIDELRSTSELNSNIPYFEIGMIYNTSKNNEIIEKPEYW